MLFITFIILIIHNTLASSNSTHFIITMKPLVDPPEDICPEEILDNHINLLTNNIKNIHIIHKYNQIAKYLKIYMFSIQLLNSDDISLIGNIFGSQMKNIESVSSFYATELVTDVRNLAHGLPYRQVLTRPFRDLNEISNEKVDLQDMTCTIKEDDIVELMKDVYVDYDKVMKKR